MKTVKEHLVVHVLSTANHDVQLCFRSDSYSLEVCETVVEDLRSDDCVTILSVLIGKNSVCSDFLLQF